MLAALNKKFMWFIVAWFAILQTVAPFVHGHLGVDSAAQGHGLHIHMQEVAQSSVLQSDYAAHTLQNADIEVHTVGINDAVLKNIDLLTAPLSGLILSDIIFIRVDLPLPFGPIVPVGPVEPLKAWNTSAC